MASLKERASAAVERLRARSPLADHAVRTVAHYLRVNGNAQAGAVTYFGFLSFFPLLALGFFAVGLVAHVYPQVDGTLARALQSILPGVVGNGPGEIPLRTFEADARTVGFLGLLGLLYSGLGWLSALRGALEVVFRVPRKEQPSFLVGKARDLATLGLIGVTLVLSVALSGAVSGLSERILGWLGLGNSLLAAVLLPLIGHGLAIATTTGLFLALFLLLVEPSTTRRGLVEGALLGAVAFELLKTLANLLIAQTRDRPAAQAFGVALILLVWINYFSRIVMFGASWAYTDDQVQESHRGLERPQHVGQMSAGG